MPKPSQPSETPEQRQDRARNILAERRARDVCRWFYETGASLSQREFLGSETLFSLATSANQGGKTTSAIAKCAAMVRGGIDPKLPWFGPVHVVIVVPSRAQAASIWGKRLLDKSEITGKSVLPNGEEIDLADQPLIPPHEIERVDWAYSPQGKYPGLCLLKNGSTFIFVLSGDTNSWKRLQGVAKDWVFRDEAVGNEDLGNELLPRLAKAQTRVSKGERPWGGGITWVATATLVNNEFEAFKKRCQEGVEGHAIYWINPSENPAVSMEVRVRMAKAMTDEEADVRLYGTADAIHDVMIYRRQWKTERHVLPSVWDENPYDNIWMCWDPGWDHPYGLMFATVCQDYPNRIRIVKGFAGRHKTLDHIANEAAMWLNGRKLEAMVFDIASKKTEHSRGTSISVQFETMLRQMQIDSWRGLLYGRNRYEDTIQPVQRYLDPDPNDKSLPPLLVFDPPTTDNGMGLVIEQMVSYRTKANAKSTDRGYNIHKENDQFPDLIRYLISRKPFYSPRGVNRAKSYRLSYGPSGPPRSKRPDELQITPDMDPGMVVHIQRLRESSQRMAQEHLGRGMPVLPSQTWGSF